MFDNGRLKTANFNTDQGFGLRAVAGEATGYAHSSELSEAALLRAADAVSAVKGGYSGTLAEAPPRTNRHLYGDENPIAAPSFAREGQAAAGDRRLAARPRSARAAGDGLARRLLAACRDPARRRPDRARHPPAGARQRRRWSSATATARRPAPTAWAGARVFGEFLAEDSWKFGADEALRQALVNLEAVPAPAGTFDIVLSSGWPGVMLHEAVGHGLEGDFNRKKTSAFAGLMGQQVAVQGRHRGRRRHDRRAARLAHRRRRGHADQPHRADRGRQARRLHAGPAECAADGHERRPATAAANPTRTSRCRA